MTRSRHPRFTRAKRAFLALYCSLLWIAFFSLAGTALGWTSRNPLRDRQYSDSAGLRVERTTSYAHKTTYRRRAIPCATERQSNRSAELTGVSTDWELGNMPAPIKRGLAQSTLGAFDVMIARDRLGQELARRLPGGVVSVWERDTFARPTEQRILTGATTQSPGRSVSTHQYHWAAPEEIASITTLGSDTKVRARSAFEYDPRGSLIRELFANGETLVRQTDSVGNLYRSADFGDREYGKGGVIRRSGGTTYETDADGFLVKKTLSDGAVWHYAWDAHGQLTEVTRPDRKKVAFAYDAFGRRVSKTFDGATTAFIWDGDDLVHERVQGQDGAFLPLTTWVFEPGSFTPLAKIEGRKRYGIVGDHLGAPTMLATEAGELAWQAQLDIYGVPREDVSGIKAEHRTENPWRYPGQYEDKETGLYYNRFRYYDPELGRYISEDPIGLEGGLPQYGYVHDPLGWVDPDGLTGTYIFTDGNVSYIGKGAKKRANTSLRQRFEDRAASKFAHMDFGDNNMGFMVEHLLMKDSDAVRSEKFLNKKASPGLKKFEAASKAVQALAKKNAAKLLKKFQSSCGK